MGGPIVRVKTGGGEVELCETGGGVCVGEARLGCPEFNIEGLVVGD